MNDWQDQADAMRPEHSPLTKSTSAPTPSLFEQECEAVGRASAAAKLRFDKSGPEMYQRAYRKYRESKGPSAYQDYFVRKCLGLRLNAIKRGMVVDPSVTPDHLRYITDGICPVTLEPLEFETRGQSKLNPSVDRLVNDVGYRAGNICVLSQRANRAKDKKSFEEVASIATQGEPAGGLEPVEWMRLCSLMYGAWDKAYQRGDPHLLPLAAIPGPGMFMSTSQVVQLMLTRLAQGLLPADRAHTMWRELTVAADAQVHLYEEMVALLEPAIADEEHPGNAWLHGDVFTAFEHWYNASHRTLVPHVEGMLQARTELRDDPVAKDLWPVGGRYHH